MIAAVAVRLMQASDVPVMGALDGGGREVSVKDGLRLVDGDELPHTGPVVEQGQQVRETGIHVRDQRR